MDETPPTDGPGGIELTHTERLPVIVVERAGAPQLRVAPNTIIAYPDRAYLVGATGAWRRIWKRKGRRDLNPFVGDAA